MKVKCNSNRYLIKKALIYDVSEIAHFAYEKNWLNNEDWKKLWS